MSPVGVWRDERGDLYEIRRRPYGYLVRCTPEDDSDRVVENVRWRNEQLKWTLRDQETEEVRHYETMRIQLHQMVVQWKSVESQAEETFTRESA